MKNESFKKIIEEFRNGNLKFHYSIDSNNTIVKCRAFAFPLLLGKDLKNVGFKVAKNGYEITGKELLKLIKDNKNLLTSEELKNFENPIRIAKKEKER